MLLNFISNMQRVCVCVHLVRHAFSMYGAHVRIVPLQCLSEGSAVDSRAWVSSWPSHHALSVGSLECPGMWAWAGGEGSPQRRIPLTPQPPPPPRFPPVLQAPALLFLVLCLKNECQEAALLFSLYRGEKEVSKLGGKGG